MFDYECLGIEGQVELMRFKVSLTTSPFADHEVKFYDSSKCLFGGLQLSL